MEGAHFDHRVSGEGAVTRAKDREGCCRNCYENTECVAAAFHEVGSSAAHTCYLHASTAGQGTGQQGVVGCVTNRTAGLGGRIGDNDRLGLVMGWPLPGAPMMDWVGGNRHPDGIEWASEAGTD